MTGAHFDPEHPAFRLYERDERILCGLILAAGLALLPIGIAIALWKRARGEGWSITWPR